VEPVSQEGVAPGLKAAKEADIPIITVAQKAKQQERARASPGAAEHAADSQALLQLKWQYCNRHDCLRCRFGTRYLQQRKSLQGETPSPKH